MTVSEPRRNDYYEGVAARLDERAEAIERAIGIIEIGDFPWDIVTTGPHPGAMELNLASNTKPKHVVTLRTWYSEVAPEVWQKYFHVHSTVPFNDDGNRTWEWCREDVDERRLGAPVITDEYQGLALFLQNAHPVRAVHEVASAAEVTPNEPNWFMRALGKLAIQRNGA